MENINNTNNNINNNNSIETTSNINSSPIPTISQSHPQTQFFSPEKEKTSLEHLETSFPKEQNSLQLENTNNVCPSISIPKEEPSINQKSLIQIQIDENQPQQNFNKDINNNNNKYNNNNNNPPKIYQCPIEDCKKIFYDKSSFRKHQLTHGEKLYECKTCGKKFLDNSKLRRHSLVHSGEKPFCCNICGKKFSLDFNLRTHYRIHSGEKPYACTYPGCFKRFSQSSNLSAHEKTHEIAKNINFNNNNNNYGKNVEENSRPIFHENPLKFLINNQ